ncbi:MAG: pyridoxal-5'-phosphate-dependent protein subunit beta, partial [Ilumatobacteraceae bacterium]
MTTSASTSSLRDTAMVEQLGLADTVVNAEALEHSVARCRERKVVLPTFAQLSDPRSIDVSLTTDVDKNAPDARNLFRVHWYNDMAGNRVAVPDHIVLPSSLTGIESPIIVMFGDRFPMITAHKVLAAYACLAPRIITGQFDPTHHRAIWPSTGNYARGGVAISKIMGARGVAVLPAGMSQERFDWLDHWTSDPSDIIRTPGTESNVKEIYDACNDMRKDPRNFIFNQFCEFANHLVHWQVTGNALAHVFDTVRARTGNDQLRLAAFTSATGSAGTIAAGDRLKDLFGTSIGAVEAL